MDEVLLSYYNRELSYIRKMGAEFADQHPKIAGRLRLDKDTVEDPHVSRLIESFAFLTARIRHTLDDSFPELTEALMGVLYPDYHAPVPSMSVVNFSLLPEFTENRKIASDTMLVTDSNPLGQCYYRTVDEVDVYPLRIMDTQFNSQPYKAPALPSKYTEIHGANQAVMRISIHAEPGTTISEISPAQLQFYINGQPQLTGKLYEMLLTQVTGMALARGPDDPNTRFLPAERLKSCGLNDDKSAIPVDGRSSLAHRLLTEYFAFPEKFMFVEINELENLWSSFEEQAYLYIYFKQTHPEMVQGVSGTTMILGCAPVVNLFEQPTESIPADEIGVEAKLSVDATHAQCADIHTLMRVYARNQDGKCVDLQPFYGSHRSTEKDTDAIYWNARRETSHWYNGRISHGIDTYLAFVDSAFTVSDPDGDWIINADALCTNRDLPDKLPFGPDQPGLNFLDGGAGVRMKCMTAPTSTIQPKLDDATRWQLITQLSLQHFTCSDGMDVLKETLHLYNFSSAPDTRALIDGITGMESELTTARIVQQGRAAICQGTCITLELDEHQYSGSGIYLFTEILSEFFAQYCTINTFVQLNVKIKQRPGNMIEWPPRTGKRVLM